MSFVKSAIGIAFLLMATVLVVDAYSATTEGPSPLTTTKTSTLTQYSTTVIGGSTTTLTNLLTKVVVQTVTSVLTQVGTSTVFLLPTTTIIAGQTQTVTSTVTGPVTTYYYPVTTSGTTTTLSFSSFTYGSTVSSYTPPAGQVDVYVYQSTSQTYGSYVVPEAGASVQLLPPPTSSTCVTNCVGPAMTQITDVNGKAVFTGVPTGMAYITVTDIVNQVEAQSVFVGSSYGALVKFNFIYNLSIVRASILGGLVNMVGGPVNEIIAALAFAVVGGAVLVTNKSKESG